MKRLVGAVIVALVVLSAGPSGASADTSPSDPQHELALINQIRAQLSSNLADALRWSFLRPHNPGRPLGRSWSNATARCRLTSRFIVLR